MLNIVVPMAGLGKRFTDAGYVLPKPLLPVYGKTMIERVVENIYPSCIEVQVIFLCLKEHIQNYNCDEVLKGVAPGCQVLSVDTLTQGAACTVLLAEHLIDNKNSLMIVNSDQLIGADINDFISKALTQDMDGYILTMKSNHPKWSYVAVDAEDSVYMVREKEVISDEATVGIYYFKSGRDFIFYAKQMIEKGIRINGEFYVAPVYNEMILASKEIGYYNIGDEKNGMFGLGTPEDYEYFLQSNKENFFVQ